MPWSVSGRGHREPHEGQQVVRVDLAVGGVRGRRPGSRGRLLLGRRLSAAHRRPHRARPVRRASPSPSTVPTPVIEAYTEIAARFTAQHPTSPSREALPGPRRGDGRPTGSRWPPARPPDLFLMDHDDLSALSEDKAVRRVDDLLGRAERGLRRRLQPQRARGVQRGLRAAVHARRTSRRWSSTTTPSLIELDPVAEPGRNAVDQNGGWSLDEFAAARPAATRTRGPRPLRRARRSTRWRRSSGRAGARSSTTPTSPTTLTLSDGASAAAMEKLLEIVRDPAADLQPEGARTTLRARPVQGGQARHDAGLPQPDAGRCGRSRPASST